MALDVRRKLPRLGSSLATVIFTALTVTAQSNWGPSVTSMGFGGPDHVGGFAPSVTSLGFGQAHGQNQGGHFGFSPTRPDFDGRRHEHISPYAYNSYYPSWGGYYYYPMVIDANPYVSGPDITESSDEYKGGPTIFDRRGQGQYPAPGSHRPEPAPEPLEAKATPPLPPPIIADQPQTILVFKDGHKSSVDNYAIVGNVLYDLSGGSRRKIALAELDLTATAQQNDERGVDFELPASK